MMKIFHANAWQYLAIVLCSVAINVSSHGGTSHNLEDYCNPLGSVRSYQALTLAQTVELRATLGTDLKQSGCRSGVVFEALNSSFGFLVSLADLNIPGNEDNCTDYVKVTGLLNKDLNDKPFCGEAFPTGMPLRTDGDKVTILWNSQAASDTGTPKRANFRIVIVQYLNGSSQADCPESWKLCGTGTCIEGRVWCDGLYNCEDGGDETAECNRPEHVVSIPAVVVIVVLAMFLIILVVLVVYVRKKRSAAQHIGGSTLSHTM
ncbi:uncharacterized protein LOC135371260 [Ornithodoros turicata]|uniref:uncharacterized protein LOC135371260 n=1 Tax=Ornithodoros turicata TaxID=34597 RepID=UPI003138EECF